MMVMPSMRGSWLGLVVLWGCSDVPAYRCTSAESCGPGLCEPSGWCSSTDPSCPSGRRYVPEAGDGLAGECVAEGPADAAITSDGLPPADAPPSADAPADIDMPFGMPTNLAVLNSPGSDDNPSLTADLLEIYFQSDRAGTGFDIYQASRVDPAAAWTLPTLVTEVSTNSYHDLHPSVAADGLTLWLASNRGGTLDVFVSTRTSRALAWGLPVAINELNGNAGDMGFKATASTLVAVMTSDRGADFDIFFTTRPSTTYAWQEPALLTELDAGGYEGDPFLFDDSKSIAFSAIVAGGAGGRDLYTAARPSEFGTFQPPLRIDELNTASHEDGPWFTQDGNTIFFSSNRDGDFDLYEAHR
jgi:Tol biopolymer transport system component